MKEEKTAYQRAFLFGEEEIWNQLPPKVREKALVLCAQMVIELHRRAREELKRDESENHS